MIVPKRAATAFGLLSGFLLLCVRPSAAAEDRAPATPEPPQVFANPSGEPQFPTTYGRLDASRDAYQRAESKRRRAIDRQIELNDEMVWYSGHPGYDRDPPGLDTIYAYGHTHGRRPAARRTVRLGGHFGFSGHPYHLSHPRHGAPWVAPWGVFEPWPFVPGDIWGYPYLDRVEQPLGHKVIRTGPNSYIARPVYASDLEDKEPPPTAADQPTAPEAAVPEPIPAPPPRSGPREF